MTVEEKEGQDGSRAHMTHCGQQSWQMGLSRANVGRKITSYGAYAPILPQPSGRDVVFTLVQEGR
jgi:hypothetical protein